MRFDPQSNYVPDSPDAPSSAARQSRFTARSSQLGALLILMVFGGGAVGGAFLFMTPSESSAAEDGTWLEQMSNAVRAAVMDESLDTPILPAETEDAAAHAGFDAPDLHLARADELNVAQPVESTDQSTAVEDRAPTPPEVEKRTADAFAAARVLAGMGRHTEAMSQLHRLLDDCPHHGDALYLLGLEACRVRDYETARDAHDRLMTVDARQANLLRNLLR